MSNTCQRLTNLPSRRECWWQRVNTSVTVMDETRSNISSGMYITSLS